MFLFIYLFSVNLVKSFFLEYNYLLIHLSICLFNCSSSDNFEYLFILHPVIHFFINLMLVSVNQARDAFSYVQPISHEIKLQLTKEISQKLCKSSSSVPLPENVDEKKSPHSNNFYVVKELNIFISRPDTL